jgi:hypothetical protein
MLLAAALVRTCAAEASVVAGGGHGRERISLPTFVCRSKASSAAARTAHSEASMNGPRKVDQNGSSVKHPQQQHLASTTRRRAVCVHLHHQPIEMPLHIGLC